MIVGQTEDGKMVHDGLFRLYDTYGLPFEEIFAHLKKHDGLPCWLSFYTEARRAGWTHNRVLARLGESLSDIYDPHFRSVVIDRLQSLYGRA